MSNRIVKTDAAGFVKDISSGIIVNDNESEYNAFIQNRDRIIQNKKIFSEINIMKSEISELKKLVQQLMAAEK
jgi:hypothetical protein